MSNFASGYIKYINHVEQINEAAIKNPAKMINEVEESYHDHLKFIASKIISNKNKTKICMLAGPSSSGKTTTAYLLKEYLGKLGANAHIISMDDFYVDVVDLPKHKDGSTDYESVDTLNIDAVKNCIKDILDKNVVKLELPKYEFTKGKCTHTESLCKSHDDIFIIEGIHALNPIFTDGTEPKATVRLYVSAKQGIKDANGEVISPFDIRLIRRIVRDIQFRGASATKTFEMWDGVVRGEDMFIRPYRLTADYTVNSVHIYEPCVLRTIAIPILRELPEYNIFYRKARELESKLMRFEPISADLVASTSLLREFIGGF